MLMHFRFLWVTCQLDAIGSCLNLPMLRKTLASLPNTLCDTYARILCNIDEEHRKNSLMILQWLAYCARPLKIEEVAEVTVIDIKDNPQINFDKRLPEPRDILLMCSSLVTTKVDIEKSSGVPKSRELVRLAHFSVKEYLVSGQVKDGPASQYSINEIHANALIAEGCLMYLLQIGNCGSLTDQTDKQFPLLRYAEEFWSYHAQGAGKDANTVYQLNMELFLSKRDAHFDQVGICGPDRPSRSQSIIESWQRDHFCLYYASLTGLTGSVDLLIKKGADVNARGENYGSALQAASVEGHDQIVKLLLEKGADVNDERGEFGTALHGASVKGHDQVVKLLIRNGADINSHGGKYGSALEAASVKGHDHIVKLLLEKGADVNMGGGKYGSASGAASVTGHYQIVKLLLERNADVNARGGKYGSALEAASVKGHDHIVKLLLEKGADVNSRGGKYGSALQAALIKGHGRIVKLLLEKGADVKAERGTPAAADEEQDQI